MRVCANGERRLNPTSSFRAQRSTERKHVLSYPGYRCKHQHRPLLHRFLSPPATTAAAALSRKKELTGLEKVGDSVYTTYLRTTLLLTFNSTIKHTLLIDLFNC